MSNVAGPESMTPFMLSNLYLYRYASLFQALYAWHGVPINVWFTTFYKSIKVPSPQARYRFPPSGYDAYIGELRTRTHTCTRTYVHRYFFVRLYARSCKLDAFATHTRISRSAGSRIPVLSSPPPRRLIRDSAVPRWGQYLARRRAVRSAGMIKLYTRPINGPETRPLKLKSAARRCPPMNYDRDMLVHLTRRSHRDRETTSGFLTSSLYIPLCGGYIRGLILAVSCPLRR